ncbi:MAG: isochorismatase family protein [Streptosporangiaceae bacterium]
MLLTAEGAVLLLIDLQQRLMPVIHDHETVLARAVRLAEAARLMDVPVIATEQNPAGLGATVPPLSAYPYKVLAKTAFSAAADPGLAALLSPGLPPGAGGTAGEGGAAGGQPGTRRDILVAGVEAHVCVLQTVLDLLARGDRVAVAADAVGSRHPADRAVALDRARQHGAEIVTSEMVLFEWLRDSRHPRFREVQKLLK